MKDFRSSLQWFPSPPPLLFSPYRSVFRLDGTDRQSSLPIPTCNLICIYGQSTPLKSLVFFSIIANSLFNPLQYSLASELSWFHICFLIPIFSSKHIACFILQIIHSDACSCCQPAPATCAGFPHLKLFVDC